MFRPIGCYVSSYWTYITPHGMYKNRLAILPKSSYPAIILIIQPGFNSPDHKFAALLYQVQAGVFIRGA